MYRAVGLLLLIVLVIIFLIFFLLFKKGCFDNFLNRQSDPPVTVFATVIKITQDYSMSGSSFGRGDYSSGYVSGYTTDNIFFETENGERLSFSLPPGKNVFVVGDTGMLTYTKTKILKHNKIIKFSLLENGGKKHLQ